MKQSAKVSSDKTSLFAVVLKGSLIALSVSLVGILVFAFALKFTSISESVISPVNQVIKGVSVLLGCVFALKKCRSLGLVSGLLIGLCYSCLAFLTFSCLAGSFTFDATVLSDALFGAIMGGISGIICVNIKKSSK